MVSGPGGRDDGELESAARSDPIRVLHVDDEPDFAELAAVHLERVSEDVEVVTETSARTALARLADESIDCVVSDYEMPEMDGLELLEAVRADRPSLPFILFTGKGSEEVASDAISAGVSDYMQKERSSDQYAVLANRVRNAVERQRARERAEEAHHRARTILENAPDAILVAVNHTHVYANPAAVDVFGVDSADDIVGTDVFELVAPESRDTARAQHAELADSDTRITRVCRTLYTPGGDTFPAEVTVRAITWDGEPGLVAIIRDLSDANEHEALRRRYATAFTEADDGIAIVNDAGELVDVNRSGARLLGHPKREVVGRQLTAVVPIDDIDAAVRDRLQGGESVSGRVAITRPDGTERVAEFSATPDVTAGEHFFIFRDVTERVEREERAAANQRALESMHRIVSNPDLPREEKVERILELGTDYLDVPYGFTTRIDGDTQEVVTAVGDHDALQPGEACPLSEAYCRKTVAEDALVAVQNAVAEGWSDDPAYGRFGLGCYVGAKVSVEDDLYGTICFAGTEPRSAPFSETERVFVELLARWLSYEQTQRRMTAELTRQNERLEEFASVVSHDLRSPLTVAEGYLELAREDGDPEAFERVQHAHERMDRIIGDLLYLAREDEKIGTTARVSLAETVESAWAVVEEADADATLAVSDALGTVEADDDRLCQLLENLFRNAVEHGGPDVEIRVTPLDDGPGFAVEDDGPGIPASERADVFEWGHSNANGSGIGLYTVAEIADGHGWTVDVAESASGGARFEIHTG